jgi:hypothetical protein
LVGQVPLLGRGCQDRVRQRDAYNQTGRRLDLTNGLGTSLVGQRMSRVFVSIGRPLRVGLGREAGLGLVVVVNAGLHRIELDGSIPSTIVK